MTTLFISYKHGTSAVPFIKQALEKRGYRIWRDIDRVGVGDKLPAEIQRGLRESAALILCLMPGTCESPWVKEEVTTMTMLGKPIFPLIFEKMSDDAIRACLRALGVKDELLWLDFTDTKTHDDKVTQLFAALDKHGIRVSPHDERERPSPDNPKYVLHQAYLNRLIERIGTINLAQIVPDQPQVNLEDVYIDLPTALTISVEVKSDAVIDWWVSSGEASAPREMGDEERAAKSKADLRGYDLAVLEPYLSHVEDRIDEYRKQYPDEKPDYRYNSWKDGIHPNVIALSVQDLIAARSRLVILGLPGSGKSTFVKHLALCLAGAQIDGWARPAALDQLGVWTHGKLSPVYVELGRFVASEQFPKDEKTAPTADHLFKYLKADMLHDDLAGYADDLKYDLEHGYAVLILDGLDEVPAPDTGDGIKARQEQLKGLAQSLNSRYPKSRIVVASRPYAYENWSLPGFEKIEIIDLKDQHRATLAAKLYRVRGLNQDEADAKANSLNAELKKRDIHPDLKNRPLFLTQMAALYIQSEAGELPSRRGALYRRIMLLLLETWTKSKPGSKSLTDILGIVDYKEKLDSLVKRLAALAYDVHTTYGQQPGLTEIGEEMLYKHLKPLGRHVAADIIPYLSDNAGVLECPGRDAGGTLLRFAHRTFQEYLAAVHLVGLCRESDTFTVVREHIERQIEQWREPCALVGDVLTDDDRKGDLWDLLNDLLDETIPQLIGAADVRWRSTWLAARIAQEQELHVTPVEKLRRGEREIRKALIDWLVKLIETAGALNPSERAYGGRVLFLLGDPRPGVRLNADGLPNIAWSDPIPADTDGQTFTFGEGKDEQQIAIPYSYRIAKYPVTYAQYAAFVEGDDGYTNDAYWTESGLKWRKDRRTPDLWNDPQWHIANHPVVGVTWYESYAFCRWLSAKTGQEIRLPTEAEWEKAARGKDGLIYPYGNTFDPSKGNTLESQIGRTSAVGIFPGGASPYGVLDMSGNVWEWCQSKYARRYQFPEDNDGNGTDVRVLRGGSWLNSLDFARAVSRFDLIPYYRDWYLGFRCARS